MINLYNTHGKLHIRFVKHLLIILLFGSLVYNIFHVLHLLNPIEKIWADFKFSDIYFSTIQEKKLDSNIYFIDIGFKDNSTTRTEISNFINTIQKKYRPKIIALDVQFKFDPNVPSVINQNLINSLNNDNIILSYELQKIKSLDNKNDSKWRKISSEYPINKNISDGYVQNLISVPGFDFGVERFFQPMVKQDGKLFKHFSISVAEKLNLDVSKLLKNNNKVMINYKYLYNDPISITDESKYEKLKDKIIIIGLFTKDKNGKPLYNEDVHYTPSNKHFFGKSPPDMYGGEILATIISNILNNDFIKFNKTLSNWLNISCSLILYFILIYLFGKSHNIFIASSILQQLILVSVIVYLSIFFVMYFNIYLDLTPLAVITFFSVEFVGLVDEFISLLENLINRLLSKYKNNKL